DQRVGGRGEGALELALAVAGHEKQGPNLHFQSSPQAAGLRRIIAVRRQTATVSSFWLVAQCSNSTSPTSGLDLLSRSETTRVWAFSVSPWNTGLGKRTSVIPRLATVVPSVVSYTVMPTRMPSVYMLLNS